MVTLHEHFVSHLPYRWYIRFPKRILFSWKAKKTKSKEGKRNWYAYKIDMQWMECQLLPSLSTGTGGKVVTPELTDLTQK